MPALPPGEVHIWTARRPPQLSRDFEKNLSPDEGEAARRFLFPKHGAAYIFAHAVLRDILSRYVPVPPDQFEFHRDPFGKPFLRKMGTVDPPRFNMSHSGEVVMIALACEQHIGVDVEEIRPLNDLSSLAGFCFTAEERAFVFNHAVEDQERGFYRCWTRKEAYIKAVGRGLSIPLHSFEASIPPGEPGRRLPRCAEAPGVEKWWLTDIEAPEGYLGALVVEEGLDRLVYSEWTVQSISPDGGLNFS